MRNDVSVLDKANVTLGLVGRVPGRSDLPARSGCPG